MLNYFEFILESGSHKLSGIVLIYNKKILLVRPKKFRRNMRKWSIPKGHVEEELGKIRSALKELREESRIRLKKSQVDKSKKVILKYKKSGSEKELTCYVVKVDKEDINVTLFNNMILSNFLKNEILEAGFFSKNDAERIIEKHQLGLLKFLD